MWKTLSFKWTVRLLLIVLIAFGACTKCDECPNDFRFRFRFLNNEGRLALSEASRVGLFDLQNQSYGLSVETNERDTFFVADINRLRTQDLADTLVLTLDGAPLDTASIFFGFAADSECCNNPRIVDRAEFYNIEAVRLVRVDYTLYSIVLDD